MTGRPRLLSGADAAAYCSVTPPTFSRWVAIGVMPRPIPGTRRWDRRAIDQMLDKASGITWPDTDDPFEAWKAEYDARSAREETSLAEWRAEYSARKLAPKEK